MILQTLLLALGLTLPSQAPLLPRRVASPPMSAYQRHRFRFTAFQAVSASPLASISVTSYGAVCDGATDDTVALQTAITAADTAPYRILTFPPSVCIFRNTLVFGGHAERYSEISLMGQSEYTSQLNYGGPMDRPALLISRVSAFHWQGLSLATPQASTMSTHGSSVGIKLDGPLASGGTMNTTITFEHLHISGFYIGMLAGGDDAASEIACDQCTFSWNDIGWTASGYNSLNFWFYGLHLLNNTMGVKLGGPWVTDGPHVLGGSSAGNTVADFYAGNAFGSLSIANFRAEVTPPAKFLTASGSGNYPPVVSLRDSVITGVGTSAAILIDAGSFHMETTHVIGRISGWADSCDPSAGKLVVTIEDSLVTPDPDTGRPMTLPASSGNYHFRFIGNRPANLGDATWLADLNGTWLCGVLGS